VLAVAVTVFPIYYLIVTSIEPFLAAFSSTPTLVPTDITLTAYEEVLGKWDFLSFLTNSLVISISSVALGTLLGVPMAYSLARFKFPRSMNDGIAFFILSIRMLPPIVGIIPLFILYTRLGLVDTYLGMTLAYTGGVNLPFTVWVMRGFFLDFPRDLEESALVDGASTMSVLLRIVVPLSVTAITTTAALIFVQTWNEFIIAVFLTTQFRKTIPVLVSSFFGEQFAFWTDMTATGVLSIIPAFIILVVVQRHVVRGLTFGAIKG
jgi:multiple sugar transport system permease protein